MDLSQIFQVTLSNDHLEATLNLIEGSESNLIDLSKENHAEQIILDFLSEEQANFGINEKLIKNIIEHPNEIEWPLTIAEGMPPVNGNDGYIQYQVDVEVKMDLSQSERIDFKEVIKIPKAEAGDLLAVIIPPTPGESGTTVSNDEIEPKPGSWPQLKPGKGVKYVEEERSYYAIDNGQISMNFKQIQVLPLYEVSESLNLKTGNIDFNGSVVIKGDIPEGFSVKARGDITVYGLVEAADLTAGGSVYVREGISGLGKGFIKAGVDIHIRNVNQGQLSSGRSIQVNQSIFHSQVSAKEEVVCQKGHIIGGSVSAGQKIVCRDVGNRMHTSTNIYLGENKEARDRRRYLENEIESLEDQLQKLEQIGQSLKQKQNVRDLNAKEKAILLKQEKSIDQTKLLLDDLKNEFSEIDLGEQVEEFIKLSAHGIIYPNTEIFAGKYSKKILREEKYISVVFIENDFTISSL
ncbi:DUF342 domain-containing protein [Aquisalibacillus elongatus]|uniref:Flagellar Assembly Protein A N-terminal region domain-containing protein n=1 Tax=Aquisalibacillus elongatus TaxID=485577 RepID=A0A3N5BLB6_9BACI|nr:FapA family protein [Aquisalibacillus elongatus]RPF55970.1 hypothetical protein EDC24_0856 [Aquisalibacillus elongatus]